MTTAKPRRYPSGLVIWRVNFRIGSLQAQESFDTQAAGESFAALVDRVGGAAARAVRDARSDGDANTAPTLIEFTNTYLSEESGMLTGITAGTRNGYRGIAARSFNLTLGEIPIDQIEKTDVGQWVAWQEAQTSKRRGATTLVAPKTVSNYHALLSAIMQAAVDAKLRTDNPAFKMKLTKGIEREGIALSRLEFALLHAAAPERYKSLLLFLVVTGCRWGEATAMTWGDLTTGDTPTVRVNKAWKKGETGRTVLGPPKSQMAKRTIAISSELVTALGERQGAGQLLFPGDGGGHLWYGGFNTRNWGPTVERSGIGRDLQLHDLRHTCCTWLILAGRPLPDVQKRMGHENIQTTIKVYNHVMPSGHAAMAGVMEGLL